MFAVVERGREREGKRGGEGKRERGRERREKPPVVLQIIIFADHKPL